MSGQDWKRLGSRVARKRYAMGYLEIRTFAQALDISERTIGRLENGHQVGRNTLLAVEHFVGWPPQTMETILAGGEPPEDVETTSKKSTKPELRDVVEGKIWAIDELSEQDRWTYINFWRAKQQQGQTG
jgi:transcriptional regulator with XRE-family HTH domain